MADPSFGEWLKRQRKALGVAQKILAGHANCSVVTIRKIESGERRPSRQLAESLGRYFDIPEDQLLAFVRYARGDPPVQ